MSERVWGALGAVWLAAAMATMGAWLWGAAGAACALTLCMLGLFALPYGVGLRRARRDVRHMEALREERMARRMEELGHRPGARTRAALLARAELWEEEEELLRRRAALQLRSHSTRSGVPLLGVKLGEDAGMNVIVVLVCFVGPLAWMLWSRGEWLGGLERGETRQVVGLTLGAVICSVSALLFAAPTARRARDAAARRVERGDALRVLRQREELAGALALAQGDAVAGALSPAPSVGAGELEQAGEER
jgi:hypothetical protein